MSVLGSCFVPGPFGSANVAPAANASPKHPRWGYTMKSPDILCLWMSDFHTSSSVLSTPWTCGTGVTLQRPPFGKAKVLGILLASSIPLETRQHARNRLCVFLSV